MDSASHLCSLLRYLRAIFSCDGPCRHETGSTKTHAKSHSIPLGGTDRVFVGG